MNFCGSKQQTMSSWKIQRIKTTAACFSLLIVFLYMMLLGHLKYIKKFPLVIPMSSWCLVPCTFLLVWYSPLEMRVEAIDLEMFGSNFVIAKTTSNMLFIHLKSFLIV